MKSYFLHCCDASNMTSVKVVIYFELNLKYRVLLCGRRLEKALIFTLSYKM